MVWIGVSSTVCDAYHLSTCKIPELQVASLLLCRVDRPTAMRGESRLSLSPSVRDALPPSALCTCPPLFFASAFGGSDRKAPGWRSNSGGGQAELSSATGVNNYKRVSFDSFSVGPPTCTHHHSKSHSHSPLQSLPYSSPSLPRSLPSHSSLTNKPEGLGCEGYSFVCDDHPPTHLSDLALWAASQWALRHCKRA